MDTIHRSIKRKTPPTEETSQPKRQSTIKAAKIILLQLLTVSYIVVENEKE